MKIIRKIPQKCIYNHYILWYNEYKLKVSRESVNTLKPIYIMITNETTNINYDNFGKINSLRIASITVFDGISQITSFIDDITDLNCGIRFNIFDDNVTVTVKYISACALYVLSIKCNCYKNENWITKLPLSNDFNELEIMQFIKTITDKLEF